MSARTFRTVVIWVALFLAAAAAGGVALLESGVLTPVLVDELNDRLAESDLSVQASSLYWRPWSGLTLGDVSVWADLRGTPGSAEPESAGARRDRRPRRLILSLSQLEVRYQLLNLLSTRTQVDRVKVVRPNLDFPALLAWREHLAAAADTAAAPTDAEFDGAIGIPRFRITDFRLLGGRIIADRDVEISGLGLAGRVEGTDDELVLSVDTAGTRLRAPRIDETVDLTGDLRITSRGVELPGLHFTAAGGRVSVSGHWDPSSKDASILQVTGYAVPLAKIGEWIGIAHPLLLADLEFSLLASGRPDSLRLGGELSGVADDGVKREIQLSATRNRDVLRVETLHVKAGESVMDVQGEFTLEADPHVRGVAVFRELDPASALSEPDFAAVTGLDGALRFEGIGLTRSTFRGTAGVEISRGTVFGIEIDRGSATLSLENGQLDLQRANVARGSNELSGSGTISAENEVDSEWTGTIVDLAEVGSIGEAAPEGNASLSLRLTGPLAGPAIDAALRFDNASVAGVRVSGLDVIVHSDRIGVDGRIEVRADATGLGYLGNVIPRGSAAGELRAGGVAIRSLELTSDRRGTLELAGDLSYDADGSLSGRADRFEIRAPGGEILWANEGPVRVERTEEELTLTGLDLRGPAGGITGDLTVHPGGESFVQASGTSVNLGEFSPYLLLPEPLEGMVDFRVDGVFGPEAISGVLAVDLRDGVWGDQTLQRLEGNVSVLDDAAQFEDLRLESSFATASLHGLLSLPGGSFARAVSDTASRARLLDRLEFNDFQAHLQSDDFDWFWELLPNVPRVAGKGSFTAHVDGPITAPIADVKAEIAGGELGKHRITWLAAEGHFDGNDLHVKNGILQTGTGVLQFDGSVPFEWSFSHPVPGIRTDHDVALHLQGSHVPVGALAPIIPMFEAVDGFADADLTLLGKGGGVYFTGPFTADDVTVTIPTFADPLVNGHVEGAFDPEGLRVTAARFDDGSEGVVTGEGRLRLENLSPKRWNFEIFGEDYHYRSLLNGIRGVGSGRVELTAFQAADGSRIPRFDGSFEVRRADMDQRALVPPEGAAVRSDTPVGVNVPDEEAPDDPLAPETVPILAEIRLQGDRNLWLRTPEMELELAGDVTLHVTPEYAGLVGDVRTVRGTYSVLNSRFTVDEASVKFLDPREPLEGLISAEATTRVLDEEVNVLVSGTLALPIIQLSTDSRMSEAEIYELLALRIRRSDDPSVASSTGVLNDAFQKSYLAAVTNRFGGELSRELGLDMFDFDAGDATGTSSSVTVGKSLGRDFFLKYRESVGTENTDPVDYTRESLESPERALTLEYRLSEIFTLQGETGTLKIGDDYLNVDLKLEWGY
ncbi:translocation/assembly module TamB domain-containing protein [bacterium]|nr:translocation/assembly module TamB domain-containing protein [bacterium]